MFYPIPKQKSPFISDILWSPWRSRFLFFLNHLKAICLFYNSLGKIVPFFFHLFDFLLHSRSRFMFNTSKRWKMKRVYLPPGGTHGWSHPVNNAGPYWSRWRQSFFSTLSQGEGPLLCESLRKNCLQDINTVWIPRWQFCAVRLFVFASQNYSDGVNADKIMNM